MGYFLLEDVFLLDEFDGIEHGLIVDSGEAGDHLEQQFLLWVSHWVVGRYYLQDVTVQVEGVLEVSDLVLELEILRTQHLLHLHHLNLYSNQPYKHKFIDKTDSNRRKGNLGRYLGSNKDRTVFPLLLYHNLRLVTDVNLTQQLIETAVCMVVCCFMNNFIIICEEVRGQPSPPSPTHNSPTPNATNT